MQGTLKPIGSRAAKRPVPLKNRLAQLAEIIGVLAIIAFVAFPLIWMLLGAFKNQIDVYSVKLFFQPTIDNFKEIFANPVFLGGKIWVSTLVSFLTVAITIPLGAAAAYVLSRHRFKGRNTLFLLILITQFVPAVVVAIPFFNLFRVTGLLDTPIALVIVYLSFTLPYAVWLLRGFFDALPVEVEEASYIDGCSELQTLRYVVVPLVLPGILVAAVFSFISAWNEFFFALILTRSDALTLPVGIMNITGPRGPMWEQVSAAGMIVMVPILIMSFMIRKYFVEGITVGAVK